MMKNSIVLRTVLVSVLFSLILVVDSYAQKANSASDWYAPQTIKTVGADKYNEIMRTLRKKDTVSLVFHYEQSTWRGLDVQDFGSKFAQTEDGGKLTFPALLEEWEERVSDKSGIAQGTLTPLSMHVLIRKVSKDAGIKADGVLVYEETIPVLRVDLSVEDGRWNDFPTLLFENGEKMGKFLHSFLKSIHHFPRSYAKQFLIRK